MNTENFYTNIDNTTSTTNEINNISANFNKYSFTIAVRDEEMAMPIIEKLEKEALINPEKRVPYSVFIGKDYPSFSKLVNTVVNNSKEEIVIFCSHRVRPSISDVEKILSLLSMGYGLVGLYRLALFGLNKELIRRIGMMDEDFIGGCYEDNDFVLRLKEANIAYYESESVEYHSGNSTWDGSMSGQIFDAKWHISNNCIVRLSQEKSNNGYPYDLGINEQLKDIETSKLFLPWSKCDNSTAHASITRMYFHQKMINIKDITATAENNIPIHLRNVPPPLETFDHPSM